MSLRTILYPATGRTFPGWRSLSILARTAHIISIGMLLGGFGYSALGQVTGSDGGPGAGHLGPLLAAMRPWWLAAGVSGLTIIALDLYKSFAVLGQLHLWATGLKLVAVGILFHAGVHNLWAWVAVAAVAGYISHAPGRLRHYPQPGPHDKPEAQAASEG